MGPAGQLGAGSDPNQADFLGILSSKLLTLPNLISNFLFIIPNLQARLAPVWAGTGFFVPRRNFGAGSGA
jgi:hypothetical protein